MSYGASFPESFRHAADYLNKILRGIGLCWAAYVTYWH
jgi:hypothetical protein